MNAFSIRAAQADDYPAILKVLETANFHHIPSAEMPELDLSCCFVAETSGRIVGVAGYKMLAPGEGKTTLMAVNPSLQGAGLGMALQRRRLEAMREEGARTVITNADLPHVIAWYKKHFGYCEIGTLAKVHEFGNPDIDHWTTLRMDLTGWQEKAA
jgi:3-keto-5-aminohexanoate cleavage enzyme